MFLYPGGHINKKDKNPLQAAKREIFEETDLKFLKQFIISENELIPIDIDTHLIQYNKRLNLPEHYHFDFRYLFIIEKIPQITVEKEELSSYKWIDELKKDPNFGKIGEKIKKYYKYL